jgi:hypothetical protein
MREQSLLSFVSGILTADVSTNRAHKEAMLGKLKIMLNICY